MHVTSTHHISPNLTENFVSMKIALTIFVQSDGAQYVGSG